MIHASVQLDLQADNDQPVNIERVGLHRALISLICVWTLKQAFLVTQLTTGVALWLYPERSSSLY